MILITLLLSILVATSASGMKCLKGVVDPSMNAEAPKWALACKRTDSMLLNFENIEGNAKTWLKKNGWNYEEWNQDDHLDRFTSYVDPQLGHNVLRVTLKKYDGDGNTQSAYNEGVKRGRQEIKTDDKSDDRWDIKQGDYVHINFGIRLDAKFSHPLSTFFHVVQFKPYKSTDSSLPVFTLGIKEDILQFSFSTIDAKTQKPKMHWYPIFPTELINDVWLTVDAYMYMAPTPEKDSELYVTVRDACKYTVYSSWQTGPVANGHKFVRLKMGQYRLFDEKVADVNRVYFSRTSLAHLILTDGEESTATETETATTATESTETETATATETETATATEATETATATDTERVSVIQRPNFTPVGDGDDEKKKTSTSFIDWDSSTEALSKSSTTSTSTTTTCLNKETITKTKTKTKTVTINLETSSTKITKTDTITTNPETSTAKSTKTKTVTVPCPSSSLSTPTATPTGKTTKTKTVTVPCPSGSSSSSSSRQTVTSTQRPTSTSQPPPTDSSGQLDQCLNKLNSFRASIGVAPLKHASSSQISCANQAAQYDSVNGFHASFNGQQRCSASAQCECKGYQTVTQCIQAYINEGPGGGHYDIIANPRLTTVACGYFANARFYTHNFY